MEPCPHCSTAIDPQRHRFRWTLDEIRANPLDIRWPWTRLDRAYTVRCPECRNTYVSRTLRRFGVLTRGNQITLMGIAGLCFIGWTLLTS